MSRMPSRKLLYGLLALASLAMLLLVTGFVLWQIGLRPLSGVLYVVAERLLLVAFCGLALWTVFAALRGLWRDVQAYFSLERRSLRRLLFQWQRQQNQHLHQQQRWQQVQYRFRLQRQRLAEANARQQRKRLLRAIQQELSATRQRIHHQEYQSLCRALRQAYRRADDAALLAVRERFICP